MKRKRLVPILILAALAGCVSATYQVIEPVRPRPVVNDAGHFSVDSLVAEVDGLNPTLEWKPAAAPDVKYDLIIYRAVPVASGVTTGSIEEVRQRGEQVYYREGLADTKHRVETELFPATSYYWSVRTRGGSGTSEWATWTRSKAAGKNANIWWMFRTPKALRGGA